jgi:hypothetical protein
MLPLGTYAMNPDLESAEGCSCDILRNLDNALTDWFHGCSLQRNQHEAGHMGLRHGVGFNDFDPGLILEGGKVFGGNFYVFVCALFALSTIIGGGVIFGSEVFLRLFL